MIEDFPQLLKKAVSGDDAAINTLLHYFEEQAVSTEEQTQAHAYLKQASRESHYAVYLRGMLYQRGYGVKQDLDMSFLLLREAASKGNARATHEVGLHFLQGMGVDQNYQNALQWLKIAAGSPYYVADAMYELGRMYEQGLGITADLVQAKTWYERAMNKQHKAAKEALERLK